MKKLTPQESQALLLQDDAILIDVREEEEFEKAHIKDAILCPLSKLPLALDEIDFKKFEGKKIIFQCLKGGRSAQAINFAQENILKDADLYNLEGGILAWAEDGLPVVTPSETGKD